MDGQPRVMGKAVDIGVDEATVPGYTTYDARYAMRCLGRTPGFSAYGREDGPGIGRHFERQVDTLDAVRLMRKAAGWKRIRRTSAGLTLMERELGMVLPWPKPPE